ncbi:Phosphoribosylaminoimidazole carboxylase ATPase subunit [Chitinispirillum alkaliphilum]|nr:Phosphoribosylaminoimidazole carboxylase ATPase subunit [Chitinispirillum alkaliphilum]
MKIGILGGGQLARMLAISGYPLGLEFVVLDPSRDACSGVLATQIVGAYDDQEKLEQFAQLVDIVTYEFENVPAESVRYLTDRVAVYPSPDALAVSRDRLSEKSMFRELGIDTPLFSAVNSLEDLHKAVLKTGLPAILKTRTLGYDGKGQVVLRDQNDLSGALEKLNNVPCILEGFVPFTREVSIIAARSLTGETAFYPISQNVHTNGILHLSESTVNDPMQSIAEKYSRLLLDQMNYVGVLALELFDSNGTLLANEIAPRVHNSGHWTIDGAHTSQFENHLRAILGLPLGDTSARCNSAMVNFVGQVPEIPEVLSIKGVHFHDYGKKPRAGRKVGHGTVCLENENEYKESLNKLLALVEPTNS